MGMTVVSTQLSSLPLLMGAYMLAKVMNNNKIGNRTVD